MALLLLEGFDNVGLSGNSLSVDGKFTVTGGNWSLAAGAWGGLCAKISTSSIGCDLRWTIPQTATFTIGFYFRSENQLAGSTIIAGYDGAQQGMQIKMTSAGSIQVLRDLTSLQVSTPCPIKAGIWHHVEFKCTINNTTGSYEVKVDGVSIVSATGVNTRGGSNNYIDSFRLLAGGGNSAAIYSYDDLYALDSSGSVNNTFLGPYRVVCLHPTADSGAQQWTTSTGTDHYALVDENPSNGNTDYNEDTVSGHADLFDCTDVSLVTVNGVQINAVVRETDASPFNINLTCKSGTTTSAGSNIAIGGQTFVTKNRVMESDPDTSTAWTGSGLDATKFGIKLP